MKNFLKILAAACAGTAVQVGSQYLPAVPPKWAPLVSAGVAVGLAYAVKSPFASAVVQPIVTQPEPQKENK